MVLGNMKNDVLDLLRNKLDKKCYKEIKEVIEDLEGIGVDENILEDIYAKRFGEDYKDSDNGFSRFVIDMISVASSILSEREFGFTLEEFAKANIFRDLAVFIKKKIDVPVEKVDYISNEEIVIYYLQLNNIELTENEFFCITDSDCGYDISNFSDHVRKICSVEFSDIEGSSDNSVSSSEESKDGVEVSSIEEESNNDNEEGGFEESEEESDKNDYSKLDETNMGDSEENEESERKEEAAASFEELFNEEV